MVDFLVVGAGLSGATTARGLAEQGGYRVRVVDRRDHVAGNCHTVRDSDSGIMVHAYGTHVFHTHDSTVWDTVNRFATFREYRHDVMADTERGIFPVPVNLLTINQFFNRRCHPDGARALLKELAVGPPGGGAPANFEEAAKAAVGEELYRAFFLHYTRKQWGVPPSQVPASVFSRVPVRFDYRTDYFDDPHVGIPLEGYAALMESMLDHPRIELALSTPFAPREAHAAEHVVWTGSIDAFWERCHGSLGYRASVFDWRTEPGDFLGVAVMNCCRPDLPHTRMHDYKHLTPWEAHAKSTVATEYSRRAETVGEACYPCHSPADREKLARYRWKAEKQPGVSFLGRLGMYRYLNMGEAVRTAADFVAVTLRSIDKGGSPPAGCGPWCRDDAGHPAES